MEISRIVKGSTKPIVAISRWKGLLATSSEDGSVKIWNLATYKVSRGFLPTCFSGSVVTSILWRNEETLLVSADRLLYSVTVHGDDIITSREMEGMDPHAEDDIGVLWCIDRYRVAVADDAGLIHIYHTRQSRTTHVLEHGQLVTALTRISGDVLVSGGLDGHVKFWNKSLVQVDDLDVAAHRQAQDGLGMINPPYVHALAASRGTLVAGLGDGALLVAKQTRSRKTRTWLVKSVTAHASAIGALAVLGNEASSQSPHVVTASNDKTCKLWLLDDLFRDHAKALSVVQLPGKVNAMTVLSDTQVVIGDVLGNLIFLTMTASQDTTA